MAHASQAEAPEPASTAGGYDTELLRRLSRMERDHFWFVGRRELVRRLLGRHLGRPQTPVLDLGCGTGSMVRELRRMGRPVVGIDMLPDGIGALKAAVPDAMVVQADGGLLPVADLSLEAVLALDVIEHVDDRRVLLEIHRALRSGGLLVLMVPALPRLWSARDVAGGHARRYTRRGLVRLLAETGFEVQEMRYYQFFLLPLVIASRALGRVVARAGDWEETPPRLLNSVLAAVNIAEVRLGDLVGWPVGSSLAAVCRRA